MKFSTVFCLLSLVSWSNVTGQQYYGNGYTIIQPDYFTKGNDLNVKVYKSIKSETVKGGLLELLKGSGWQLADRVNADPDLQRLYQQNYPDFKRTLNPITLSDALQYIAGDAWDLVVDPVNKLISFQLSHQYRCFTLKEATCTISPQH